MARPKKSTSVNSQILQSLGLSENEVVLYTKMLSIREGSVQQLMELSLFPRTLLYHILNQLIGKGLVVSKKDKSKTVFFAKDPENLGELLNKKEKEFEDNVDKVRELIPKLKNEFYLFGKIPNIRILHGVEGHQKVLDELFNESPKEIFSYENLITSKPGLEIRLAFERKRVAKKIKKNVLFFENKYSLDSLKDITYNDFTHFRGLTEEIVEPFYTDIMLYDNKILYITYPDNRDVVSILIGDKNLFAMQKNIFEQLWKKGKNRTLYYAQK